MSKIAIYGAGRYGESFLLAMKENGINADFFIDQYTKRNDVAGLPVYTIDQVKNKEIKIHISVAPNPRDTAADTGIPEHLQQHGYSNVYSFMQSLHAFPNFLPILAQHNLLWMSGQTSDMVDRHHIKNVKTLFREEKSIRLLDEIVAEKRHQPVEYIVSFEPDLKNAGRLGQEVQKQQQRHPETRFIVNASGLWSKNAILRFSNKGTSSSSISNDFEDQSIMIQIPATSLDSSLIAARPNYIKMDIEGAENEALRGAKEIIANQQPVLAICIYHQPADLWEIPLLIRQINPNYKMFLRVHGHMGLSTVLYCVPIHNR